MCGIRAYDRAQAFSCVRLMNQSIFAKKKKRVTVGFASSLIHADHTPSRSRVRKCNNTCIKSALDDEALRMRVDRTLCRTCKPRVVYTLQVSVTSTCACVVAVRPRTTRAAPRATLRMAKVADTFH